MSQQVKVYRKLTVATPASREIAGKEYAVEVDYQGTVSAGDAMIGLNVAVTPIGASPDWIAGIFVRATQGTTLSAVGYMDAGEFEIVSTHPNPAYQFAIGLNFIGTYTDPHSAFIAIRDYGAVPCKNLLWLGTEIVAGSDGDTASLFSASGWANINQVTHTLKFMHGGTPYWIPCSTSQT